jgi:hypothetical protein
MNEKNDYHNCRMFDIDRDNKQKMIWSLFWEKKSVLKYKICLK